MASDPVIPEDEELVMDDDGEYGDDMLVSILTTEQGETIPSVLTNIASSTEAIAKQLEKQNIILVKILTCLSAAKASPQ